MSAPGVPQSIQSRRQKRMGPAPFASFEDLSDEVRSHLESPEDKQATGSVVRLPGIREDVTPGTPAIKEYPSPELVYTGISLVGASVGQSSMSAQNNNNNNNMASLRTPNAPRIDISRASSSSHHDSKDSSPDRELFEGHDPCSAKLGLGFREEGTLDLRSSTEELDFQDPHVKAKAKTRPQSPGLFDDPHGHQRKDSQSSDIVLLSISGRTSRLSSIGSQGSAQSRISNASHLSAVSGQSGLSRSPSPHKMLLETSFCGTKPPTSAQQTTEQTGTKVETEVLEKVLLSRKHDPTKAILAEGITVEDKSKAPPEKPHRKPSEKNQRCSVKSDITIKVDKPPVSEVDDSNNVPKLPRTFVSSSGVEYTYIPLKGPLPVDTQKPTAPSNLKIREIKSASIHSKSTTKKEPIATKPKSKSATPSPVVQKKDEEPKYIRIKLKPDHLYDDEDSSSSHELQKPVTLDLNESNKKPTQSFSEIIEKETANVNKIEPVVSLSNTPSASPKLSHRNLRETPSPSLSRRSSFASLFKSRETIISPESPTIPGLKRKNTLTGIIRDASESLRERSRSRSRSKSRERDKSSVMSAAPSSTESIDSNKSRQKSVFSIFKSKKSEKCRSEADSSSSEILPSIEGIGVVEFRFNPDNKYGYHETPLEGNSIRIPLHSPSEERSILQEVKSSSQDSQDTVIECPTKSDSAGPEIDKSIKREPKNTDNFRQSSTSSENIVFSTKLGSTNEIFTTKLPKEKYTKKTVQGDAKKTEDVTNDAEKIKTIEDDDDDKTEKIKTDKGINREEDISKNADAIKRNSFNREDTSKKGLNYKEDSFKKDVKREDAFGAIKREDSITGELKKEISLEFKKEKVKKQDSYVEAVKKDTMEVTKTDDDKRRQTTKTRNSTASTVQDDEHNSSESERDSEVEFFKKKTELDLKLEEKFSDVEPERKGLVLQDNDDDELPYVPTTLPLERSVAIPIVPIKQRGTFEMKTCPIERPRSTTPINPSCLEEYCEEVMSGVRTENITKAIEKIRISLPKEETEKQQKVKSPRKGGSNTNWFEFAEKGISLQRRSSFTQEKDTTPPPLPPKGIQKEWINFEEIPERRKPPKRIQTIPSRGTIEVPDSLIQDNVVYNYVNPEDCKCECHEISAREQRERERKFQQQRQEAEVPVQEDELPLLEDEANEDEKNVIDGVDRMKLGVTISDQRSTVSDSSIDLSTCVEQSEMNGGIEQQSLRTPFTSDLGISSNRSSVVSQDEPQSPESLSPNAFPRTS